MQRKGAAERSADSYIGAVETAVATAKLDGKDIPDGTYKIDGEGNLTGTGLPDGKLEIDMKGNKPKDGTITIKNGQVTNDSTMTVGDYDVKYNEENKKYEATEKGTSSTEVLCKAVTTATTGNVPSGSFNYGDEYTCELGDNDAKTFFVLETNGDNVSLIMNANVDSNGKAITPDNIPDDKGLVSWCKSGTDISCNADGVLEYLSNSVQKWTKLSLSHITLPTADQIAVASGKVFNNSSFSPLAIWLYNYLNGTTNDISGVYGYWTITPNTSANEFAYSTDTLGGSSVHLIRVSAVYSGVRPVITISKSQLG